MDGTSSASTQPYRLCQVDRNEKLDLHVSIPRAQQKGVGGDAMRP